MSPTYDALQKLVVGLCISLPQLFTPPVNNQISGRMAVRKIKQRPAHTTATYAHEFLSESLMKKRMTPYHTAVWARSIEEFAV